MNDIILLFKPFDSSRSFTIPEKQTKGSAGLDLRASLDQDVILYPQERVLIPTNLCLEIPIGYEVQIRSRSGLALKNGITVLNSPGTIDSDYRGEIGVILYNSSNVSFPIKNGDRIAQMILAKVENPFFVKVKSFSETFRGEGGFGSTEIK